MSTALLVPATDSNAALHHSQAAGPFLSSQSRGFSLPYPLSLLTTNESQEKWQSYENVFLACLRTGDNDSAYRCLEDLTERFGKTNERVMALQGLYQEATAGSQKEAEDVLKGYDEVLAADPTIFPIRKRRAALLRSLGRTSEAAAALTELLDSSPTDAEAWSELADLYLTQGLYEQAIYCLEEVLLVMPNAWNIHARLGEVLVLSASRAEAGEQVRGLSEAMRRFCRSVELCDDYLRGYYGLQLSTSRLIPLLSASSKPAKSSDSELPPPSLQTTQKLHEVATSKLAEIVRRSKAGDKDWNGYSEAELIAAQALLDQSAAKVAR